MRHPRQAPPQVRSVLGKLELCRTAALGGRTYECPRCKHECQVYNSCVDRHCPLCSGAKRGDWLDKTAQLLLPKIHYFQVIFTLPEPLWRFAAKNRRQVYTLLFHAAWAALRELLQEKLGIEPAALMVLHTWNQELEHFPHIHALVPGGGPSADGTRWIHSKHPFHRRRRKPYLVDHEELSGRFRKRFIAGMERLHRRGELKFGPLSMVCDYDDFVNWLANLPEDWVAYIEPPPQQHSDPKHVLKYLARYLTGGPISDRRLITHEDGQVTFWARSKNKMAGNPSRPFPLPGIEFTRRWALHILPKGFTKSRCYGGFSSRLRRDYLSRCRALLKLTDSEPATTPPPGADEPRPESTPKCPHCETPLECIRTSRRASWRDIFNDFATCPVWYGLSLPSNGRVHHPREPDG